MLLKNPKEKTKASATANTQILRCFLSLEEKKYLTKNKDATKKIIEKYEN